VADQQRRVDFGAPAAKAPQAPGLPLVEQDLVDGAGGEAAERVGAAAPGGAAGRHARVGRDQLDLPVALEPSRQPPRALAARRQRSVGVK
jgi:hypothetical protein